MEYVMGIDAGTSVVKATIFSLEGREVARAARTVPIHNPESYMAEEDLQDVWMAAVDAISESLTGSAITPDRIRAVAVTGQGDGSWLVDTAGNPVGPAILWTDGRAGEIVERWGRDGTMKKTFKKTGGGPYAGTTAAILRWRIENQPELVERDDIRNVYCKDWVSYKLSGELNSDPSDYSLMGIDTVNRTFDDELLEDFGITAVKKWLPELKKKTDQVGEITHVASQQTGLRPGTPVFKGGVDISCSSLGAGVAVPGSAMAVIGTAGIVNIATDEPEKAFAPVDVGWLIPHTDTTWIRSLGMNSATPNLEWFLREFGEPFREEASAIEGRKLFDYLDQELKKMPVGSGGILYHGYNAPGGERAPFIKPSARASFNGITGSHSRWQMLKSVYEGVALGIRDCLDPIPVKVDTINMAGGGVNSPVWSQIFADVLGRTVVIPAGTEFGAKGAAIVAATGAGLYDSLEEGVAATVEPLRVYEPDNNKTALYDELYGIYQRQRAATEEVWDDLQAFTRKAARA